jgi:hypothetical protein
MATAPFWQLAILQVIGPTITVLFGTLAAGIFAARITARAQRRREDQQLRQDLVVGMAETASALYLATQRYWRAKDREKLSVEPLQILRSWLDDRYHENRVRGEALETRLRVMFLSDDPRRHWHATMDLLTARYFQLTDPENTRAIKANEGPEHSGLSFEELGNPRLVLEAYRRRLDDAVTAVRTGLFARREEPRKARPFRYRLILEWLRLGRRRSSRELSLAPARTAGQDAATLGHP